VLTPSASTLTAANLTRVREREPVLRSAKVQRRFQTKELAKPAAQPAAFAHRGGTPSPKVARLNTAKVTAVLSTPTLANFTKRTQPPLEKSLRAVTYYTLGSLGNADRETVDEALLLSFAQVERVHWWFVVRRRLVLEQARRWAQARLQEILEVGCGTGATLRDLSACFPGATVRGVEPCPAALQLAAAAGSQVMAGSFEHIPVATGAIDLLLALDVLEHLDDDRAGLLEAARVLRPGGRLILTVPALPALWGPHDELNGHRRRYSRAALLDRTAAAGFRVERATFFNTVLLPLALGERSVARLRGRASPVTPPTALVNEVLRRAFALELPVLRRTDLPTGLSLLLVATR
jgi:SAM-dependent methyltransferase